MRFASPALRRLGFVGCLFLSLNACSPQENATRCGQALVPSTFAETSHLKGFETKKLPQFVAITFDDNFEVDGIVWANSYFSGLTNPEGAGRAATFDGTPARTTFYNNAVYATWAGIQTAWADCFAAGHEIGNHTFNHPHGVNFLQTDWDDEIESCTASLTSASEGVGALRSEIQGFRAPYLEYNDATFSALEARSFRYDTTLQGCWADEEDGTNCHYPYTLHAGSSDNATLVEKFGEEKIGNHPKLWEVPVSALVIPPDGDAMKYGFDAGLRERTPTNMPDPSHFDPESGKIAPLDHTLLVDAGMSPEEMQATLRYNLDLHYQGNRAPLVFIAHTHVYSEDFAPGKATARRAAVEAFLTYALSLPDVRLRPVRDIITWLENPVDLEGNGPTPDVVPPEDTSQGNGGASDDPDVPSGLGGAGGAAGTPCEEVQSGCSYATSERGRGVTPSLLALLVAGLWCLRRRRGGDLTRTASDIVSAVAHD